MRNGTRVVHSECLKLQESEDITRARQVVRSWAVDLNFSLADQTKIVTAASELARNTIDHGCGGKVRLERVSEGDREGLKLIFEDRGPGIADLDLAQQDGYSSSSGLGLGLGGSKRLVDQFAITSKPGEGTCVTVVKWV